MIAFKISRSSTYPIFICDFCHKQITTEGSAISADDRDYELLVAWITHKSCTKDLMDRLPYSAVATELSDVLASFTPACRKPGKPIKDISKVLDESLRRLFIPVYGKGSAGSAAGGSGAIDIPRWGL